MCIKTKIKITSPKMLHVHAFCFAYFCFILIFIPICFCFIFLSLFVDIRMTLWSSEMGPEKIGEATPDMSLACRLWWIILSIAAVFGETGTSEGIFVSQTDMNLVVWIYDLAEELNRWSSMGICLIH